MALTRTSTRRKGTAAGPTVRSPAGASVCERPTWTILAGGSDRRRGRRIPGRLPHPAGSLRTRSVDGELPEFRPVRTRNRGADDVRRAGQVLRQVPLSLREVRGAYVRRACGIVGERLDQHVLGR